MKRIIALLSVIITLFFLLTSCTGTTPDVAATQEEVTLENLDWSITLEGCDRDAYTLTDAKAHDLTKGTVSMLLMKRDCSPQNIEAVMNSMIIEGVSFKEFLADVGRSDATEVSFSGKDVFGAEFSYTMTPEEFNAEKTVIGWIANKKETLVGSENYVGIFDGSSSLKDFGNCLSVDHIIVK